MTKSFILRILVILCSGVITLIVTEFLITANKERLPLHKPRWIMNYWEFQNTGIQKACNDIDPLLIYRPTKNSSAHLYCPETDSLGFRITMDQQIPDAPDILFLGDSFTYGENVADNETLPYQTAVLFQEAGIPVNVHNAGVRGYGMDQEILFLKNYILPELKPDIVVWNVYENDEYDNNEACLLRLAGEHQLTQLSARRNTLYLLASLFSHTPKPIRSLNTYWLLFNLVPQRFTIGCTLPLEDYGHIADTKTKALIKEMLNLSSQFHFRLLPVYIAGKDAYREAPLQPPGYADETQRKITAFRSQSLTPFVVHEAIAEAQKLPPVFGDPTETTDSADPVAAFFFTDDVHMNAAGNRIFARTLFTRLRDQLAQ